MEIKLTSIEGNRQWLDGGSMFGNAPRAVWEKWVSVDDQGRIPLACRCLLVQTPTLNILLEAGVGAFFEPKLAQRFGIQTPDRHRLLENLKAHGLSHEDIDFVVLSHLHFDHAGGLLPTYQEMQNDKWELLFPKATYVVGQEAWDRALKPHYRDRASFLPELNTKLQESGRLFLVNDLKPPPELSPFLQFVTSQGHTPGQMHTLIQDSQSCPVLFAGDLIPGRPWVHLPITLGYDRFPEKLIEEKQEVYQKWGSQNLKLFFTHDSEVALATLGQNEKGKYVATREVASLSMQSLDSL